MSSGEECELLAYIQEITDDGNVIILIVAFVDGVEFFSERHKILTEMDIFCPFCGERVLSAGNLSVRVENFLWFTSEKTIIVKFNCECPSCNRKFKSGESKVIFTRYKRRYISGERLANLISINNVEQKPEEIIS